MAAYATKAVAAVALFLALCDREASAADIVHTLQQGAGFIMVRGRLESQDGKKFNAVAQQYQRAAVLLAGDGGSVVAAMEIGRTIGLRGFSTGVAPGMACASACALAWLGGSKRYMSQNSRIGFHHAAYTVGDAGAPLESGLGNAVIGAYATQLALPLSAVIYISRSGAEADDLADA